MTIHTCFGMYIVVRARICMFNILKLWWLLLLLFLVLLFSYLHVLMLSFFAFSGFVVVVSFVSKKRILVFFIFILDFGCMHIHMYIHCSCACVCIKMHVYSHRHARAHRNKPRTFRCFSLCQEPLPEGTLLRKFCFMAISSGAEHSNPPSNQQPKGKPLASPTKGMSPQTSPPRNISKWLAQTPRMQGLGVRAKESSVALKQKQLVWGPL